MFHDLFVLRVLDFFFPREKKNSSFKRKTNNER